MRMMAEGLTATGRLAFGAFVCVLAAAGIGGILTGKVVLGALALILSGWFAANEIVIRRRSDALALRAALAQPFFLGTWFVALGVVVAVSSGSLDWIVIVPVGVFELGVGPLLVLWYRRTRDEITIRLARPDEGPRLKEIAIAAKSSWGYDAESVRQWADDGDFSPTGLARLVAFVAEKDGRAAGWASLLWKTGGWWLEDLWVEPAWMGKGVGSRLFRHAAAHARSAGATRLHWEAEPHAVEFYEHMGGRYVRDSESTAWGRIIPIMELDLGD
jgi:GNAT superfamily N-acetyltransferase